MPHFSANSSFWPKNPRDRKNCRNPAICQTPSALRRTPQSHLLPIIPWVQSSWPSTVCQTDHSDSAGSPPVSQPVNQVSHPHTNPRWDWADNPGPITSITPPRPSWMPVTLIPSMASHYSSITIKFPRVSVCIKLLIPSVSKLRSLSPLRTIFIWFVWSHLMTVIFIMAIEPQSTKYRFTVVQVYLKTTAQVPIWTCCIHSLCLPTEDYGFCFPITWEHVRKGSFNGHHEQEEGTQYWYYARWKQNYESAKEVLMTEMSTATIHCNATSSTTP